MKNVISPSYYWVRRQTQNSSTSNVITKSSTPQPSTSTGGPNPPPKPKHIPPPKPIVPPKPSLRIDKSNKKVTDCLTFSPPAAGYHEIE